MTEVVGKAVRKREHGGTTSRVGTGLRWWKGSEPNTRYRQLGLIMFRLSPQGAGQWDWEGLKAGTRGWGMRFSGGARLSDEHVDQLTFHEP